MLRLIGGPVALSVVLLRGVGCGAPTTEQHTPEITIENRAVATERASTPFVEGAALNFPAIESGGQPYWVVFVDQMPCAPSDAPGNPKAFAGGPGHAPSCRISLKPTGRDRLFRYALVMAPVGAPAKSGPPPMEIPYSMAPCRPTCG